MGSLCSLRQQMRRWDRKNCFDFAKNAGYELGREMAFAKSMEEKKSIVTKCIDSKISSRAIAEATNFYFWEINALLYKADEKREARYWDFSLVVDFAREDGFEQGFKEAQLEILKETRNQMTKAAPFMKQDGINLDKISVHTNLSKEQIEGL